MKNTQADVKSDIVIHELTTVTDCQRYCQAHSKCEFFLFYPCTKPAGRCCKLKTVAAGAQITPATWNYEKALGPKYCPGKHTHRLYRKPFLAKTSTNAIK